MTEHRYSYLQSGNTVRGYAQAGKGREINLTEAEAIAIGKAFANWLIYKVEKNPVMMQVCVGIDTRDTSEMLAVGLMKGLHAFGTSTGYAGTATAPAMYLSTALPYWEFDGSILVTAGDDSDAVNGFRFFTADGELTEEEVADVLYHASRAYLSHEEYEPEDINLMAIYATMLRAKLSGVAGIKVCVDTSNFTGDFFAKNVIEPMKIELADAEAADIRITISQDGTGYIAKSADGSKLESETKGIVPDGMLAAVQVIAEYAK